MKNYILLFAALILFFSPPLQAQTNFNKISVDIGMKNGYQSGPFDESNKFSLFPQIQIGGNFLFNYLEWNLNWGYFDDGRDTEFNVRDFATYSYSSHIVGGYISFYPEKLTDGFSIPVYLLTGFSYHFVNEEYIGGNDFTGSHRDDNSFGVSSWDLGLGINYNIVKNLRFRLDGIVYVPLSEPESLELNRSSSSFKFGVDYILN